MSFQSHLMSVKDTSSLDNIFMFKESGKELKLDSESTICIEDHTTLCLMHSSSPGRAHC
jgi:hypothetical protein